MAEEKIVKQLNKEEKKDFIFDYMRKFLINREATLTEISESIRVNCNIDVNDDEISEILKDDSVKKMRGYFKFLKPDCWTIAILIRNQDTLLDSIYSCLSDGKVHSLSAVYKYVCNDLNITEEEKNITVRGGKELKYKNDIRQVKRNDFLIKSCKVSGSKKSHWRLDLESPEAAWWWKVTSKKGEYSEERTKEQTSD